LLLFVRDLVTEIGFGFITRADAIYFTSRDALRRARIPEEYTVTAVEGDRIRNWAISDPNTAIFPYDKDLKPVSEAEAPAVHRFLWPYRAMLWLRREPNGNHREIGLTWWEWSRFQRNRFLTPLAIAFAFVTTHNHFVLDRGGKVFSRSAPIIKLPHDATEGDHFALLGLLNSSTACFWMKQVFHPKGATSANRNHPDPERLAYEFAATGLEKFPIPQQAIKNAKLQALASRIDELGSTRQQALSAAAWEFALTSADEVTAAFAERWRVADRIRQSMVFLQEEIDWLVYSIYGLTEHFLQAPPSGPECCPRGQRAFERVAGHRSFVRVDGATVAPEDAECETGTTELPEQYRVIFALREQEIRANPLVAAIELHRFKRLWRDTDENVVESAFRAQHDGAQLEKWLTDRVEDAASYRRKAFTSSRLAADIMQDSRVGVAAEVLAKSRAYSHEGMVAAIVEAEGIPSHPFHVYTDVGMVKRQSWERTWDLQRYEDAGGTVGEIPLPQEYSQGSRGKSADFLRTEYWQIRGKLDVPRERFIAFTEVPGRSGAETLYGWAGWTPLERLKALLVIDEDLEDAGTPLADRTGVLDSAWRLLPDVAREDPQAAARLKAELQALVGPTGPSPESLEDWRKRFPPPKPPKKKTERARKTPRAEEEDETP
jgi:hypothetical protein